MSRTDLRTDALPTLFAALGDTTRLRIVERLSGGETLSIKDLAAGSRMTRQAVTKHLHVLAGAGIARSWRQGREQCWSLERKQIEQARDFLDQMARQWDDALSRLKTYVEKES